jgi:hypothetical protein
MRSSVLARIPGFRQRIIPEPHVPSRGSQARGTRLGTDEQVFYHKFSYDKFLFVKIEWFSERHDSYYKNNRLLEQ